MSVAHQDQTAASASVLPQIPVELWSKILNQEQGFTVEDFKTLCFVASHFKAICQPFVYKDLAVRGADLKVPSRYSWFGASQETTSRDAYQWKRDVAGLIRGERRLCLVGDDPSLSTFPQTISVGVTTGNYIGRVPPIGEAALSKAAYNIFSQFKATLARTLPSFTRLRRLEVGLFPIDDGLLGVIASHLTLHELKVGPCSFTSPNFSIPSIRLLEYNQVSLEQAPAAFRLASSQHLEELRIENMEASVILEGLRARPETESTFTKLHRLTIIPPSGMKLGLFDMETLLSYVPALRQLDLGKSIVHVPEGNQTLKPSTIPYLQQFCGPLSFARYVIPGRPVSDIRYGEGRRASRFAKTWPELQADLNPLCLSTAGAEGVLTLHLPNRKVAPIWLLSRFVAERFPNLVDLRLPVGMDQPRAEEWDTRLRMCCGPPIYSAAEGLFEDSKTVEGMLKDIRDSVENELAWAFNDPDYRADGEDYATRRVSPPPPLALHTSVSSPEVDVAATLARFCTDVVLDSAGMPSRYPTTYQEALVYFAKGWFPLPAYIQTLSLRPGLYTSLYPHPGGLAYTMEQRTCVAVVTALGERYPSLGAVTFMGSNGYHCERIAGMRKGKNRWSVIANRVK